MSQPPSYPPPSPGGYPGGPGGYPGAGQPPPSNGLAVAALVLGILTLPIAVVPLLSILGLLTALIGIGLGLAGIRRGRRIRRGTTMAGWGLGLSVAGLVIASLITFVFVRWLGDVLDWVEPPTPSEQVGQWFETDDGDLRIKVTSVACVPSESGSSSERCTFAFEADNQSSRSIYLDVVRVKVVVDGRWKDPSLDGERTLEPGESRTITGSTTLWSGETLDGLAFDADDASSHSAVVVDPGRGQ